MNLDLAAEKRGRIDGLILDQKEGKGEPDIIGVAHQTLTQVAEILIENRIINDWQLSTGKTHE